MEKFRVWFPTCEASKDVSALKEKVLLCNCGFQEECHADFLVELANEEVRGVKNPRLTTAPYKEGEDNVNGECQGGQHSAGVQR